MGDLMYPTANFNNISWPSLYSPAIEVGFLGPPVRPGGYYLSDSDGTSQSPFNAKYPSSIQILDIFRFTLYWTLIFHLPFNFIAGIYAFFNFLFPPVRDAGATAVLASPPVRGHTPSHSRSQSQTQSYSQSQRNFQPQFYSRSHPSPSVDEWLKPPRTNARRSRWTFSLLVLLTFLVLSLLRAVLGAAVLAGVLVAVYRTGGFYMSTYVCLSFYPFFSCFVTRF